MGKASRTKRRRAAVRSAKRSRNNNWWYGLIALVVIAGVALIVGTNMTTPDPTGPYVLDQANTSNPHNRDTHWHAALGMWDCDKWMSDGSGDGVWNWPSATPEGSPARANNTNVYAGMHSHDDGIIHMEPQVNEEAGRHATIGKYFEFGGWKISSTSFDFLGTKRKNGDKCGNGAGTLQWATAKFNGDVSKPQQFVQRTGNPGAFKLHNDDVVIIGFMPPGKSVTSLGNPPSLAKLPDAANNETPVGQQPNNTPSTMPPVNPTPTTKPKGATTPTTAATSPTTKP